MQLLGERHALLEEVEREVVGDVRLVVDRVEHLHARRDQDHREDVEDPREVHDQRGAEADHDRAQHDDAEDAPEQHAVLVDPRHCEVREDHRDDEHVVHRQRLLDEVAGHVQLDGFPSFRVGRGQVRDLRVDGLVATVLVVDEPYGDGPQQAQADVERRHPQAFLDADLVGFLVQDAEIEDEDGEDGAEEGEPHPDGHAQPEAGQQFHEYSEGRSMGHRCPASVRGVERPCGGPVDR